MRHQAAFRKWSTLVVLLPLASGVSCQQSGDVAAPAVPEVLVTDVLVDDVPISREWVGETRGVADIAIRARVPGFLQQVHFTEGGDVKKGQLLYSIDESELRQGVAAAEASLAAAKTELANASADVRRFRPLAEMNAISVRDLENAVAREEAAVARVEAAEAQLELARINLSYTRIRSPMDGLIGLTQAKVGDFVGQAPNPVVLNTVSDIDPILVRFSISEREYLMLVRVYPEGARPEAAPEDRPRLDLQLADGSLYEHPGRARTADRQVNSETGTLTIEAAFPNPDGVLRPGQYGKVRTVVETLEGALMVPQRAVQELQGAFRVWVIDDANVVTTRFVELGPRAEDLWVVASGLEAGERIVVEGFQRLRSGMTVQPSPYQPEVASNQNGS